MKNILNLMEDIFNTCLCNYIYLQVCKNVKIQYINYFDFLNFGPYQFTFFSVGGEYTSCKTRPLKPERKVEYLQHPLHVCHLWLNQMYKISVFPFSTILSDDCQTIYNIMFTDVLSLSNHTWFNADLVFISFIIMQHHW